MSVNWANNLDMLAQNGVLDFDAPAFIMDQSPRYVGRPDCPTPFMGPAPKIPAFNQPQTDEFQPNSGQDKNIVKNPSWKKWLFGGLALGALALGAWKFGPKAVSKIKGGWNKLTNGTTWKSIKTFCSDKAKAVGNFFKKGWNKITNKATWKSVKTYCVDKAKAIGNFFKKYWNKFIGLLKSKKP